MDMPELLYFSNACPSLKSIAITQEALFFPDDFNPLKNNKTYVLYKTFYSNSSYQNYSNSKC